MTFTQNSGAYPPPWRLRSRLIRLLVVMLCGFAIIGVTLRAWPSHDWGDGLEYLAMSVAFLNHGGPDIQKGDIRAILGPEATFTVTPTTTTIAGHTLEQLNTVNYPIVVYRARNNRFYSYHFWLYSLINVPALYLARTAKLPLYSSMLITNSVILFVFIMLLSGLAPWRTRRVALLALLALACGSSFYLQWTGPAVMCFTLLLAGLTLLEMRRFGWALLLFAAAAQQNPPIGFLAVVAGVCGCWRAWSCWRRTGMPLRAVHNLGCLVPGALVLVASPAFYRLEFGTFNLIVATGFTDGSLISSLRLFSIFFDLNQGMIVLVPGVMLIVFVLLVVGIFNRKPPFWLAFGLAVMSVAMAVPALSTTNWNSGAIVVMRYVYWLSAVPIYTCALLMDGLLASWTFIAGVCVLIVSQGAVLVEFGLLGGKSSYVYENRVASWLLNRHPSWYAPVPEIFAERSVHRDGVLNSETSFVHVHDGYVTILLSHGRRPSMLRVICHLSPSQASEVSSEQGWYYAYPGRLCPVSLGDGSYSVPVPRPGWSGGNGALALSLAGQTGKGQGAGYYHAVVSEDGKPLVSANGKDIIVAVNVTNDGVAPFGAATSPHTVNLGAHSIDAAGHVVINDLARGRLPEIILPGATAKTSIRLPVKEALGYRVELLPVQEGVAWFDKWGTKPLIVGPFEKCPRAVVGKVCNASGEPLSELIAAQ